MDDDWRYPYDSGNHHIWVGEFWIILNPSPRVRNCFGMMQSVSTSAPQIDTKCPGHIWHVLSTWHSPSATGRQWLRPNWQLGGFGVQVDQWWSVLIQLNNTIGIIGIVHRHDHGLVNLGIPALEGAEPQTRASQGPEAWSQLGRSWDPQLCPEGLSSVSCTVCRNKTWKGTVWQTFQVKVSATLHHRTTFSDMSKSQVSGFDLLLTSHLLPSSAAPLESSTRWVRSRSPVSWFHQRPSQTPCDTRVDPRSGCIYGDPQDLWPILAMSTLVTGGKNTLLTSLRTTRIYN